MWGLRRSDGQAPPAYLLILRLFFGAAFIGAALSKLMGGWLTQPVAVAQPAARPLLATILDEFAHTNPYPLYKRFLLRVVISRAAHFRFLIVFGELAIGLSLFTGMLTRLGAFFGIFANLNYLLMKGLNPQEGLVDMAFIAGQLVTLLGNAGRVLGVDALLHRRWPHIPLW